MRVKRHDWQGAILLVIIAALLLAGCQRGGSGSTPAPNDAPGQASGAAPVTGQAAGLAQIVVPTQAPQPTQRSSIVEAGLEEPRTLNPLFVADPVSEELSRLVFDSLVTVDPATGEIAPALADSWDVSDDGVRYTFHLRDGVRWHDGQPFTARDVEFTYRTMLDVNARSPRYSRLAERVKVVSVVDPRTVVIELIRPDASFLPTLATLGIVPEHVLAGVQPEQLITDPFGLSSAVGTGPFMLKQWVRGEQIVFERNPQYYRGTPQVAQYTYKVVGSMDELVAGLQDGLIDWAVVDAAQAGAVPAIDGVSIQSLPGFELVMVVLQLDSSKSELFLDPRVRQALMLALDRQRMIDEIWHGQAEVARGTQPPASWAAGPAGVEYSYDPEQAARLLDEAGWQVGPDGIRHREGQRLSFRLVATGADPTRRALATWLQRQWAEIGIEVQLELEQWSDVRRRATETRDFDALLLGVRWDLDPDQSTVWSSDSIFDGLNMGHYTNAELDAVLAQAVATTNREERLAHYRQAQEIVLKDLPALPLSFPKVTVLWSDRIEAPPLTATALRLRYGVEQWRLRL
uniref:ABC transporter substrate-binding protein n=1 Tax=Thermorudis peleae TaxID=1382356 RepID=A0A831TAI6_9BACT